MKFIIAALFLLIFTTSVSAENLAQQGKVGDIGNFRYLCSDKETGLEIVKTMSSVRNRAEWKATLVKYFDGNLCIMSPLPIPLTLLVPIETYKFFTNKVFTLWKAKYKDGTEFYIFISINKHNEKLA